MAKKIGFDITIFGPAAKMQQTSSSSGTTYNTQLAPVKD